MNTRASLVVAAGFVLAFGAGYRFAESQGAQGTTRRFPQFENQYVRVWKTVILPGKPLALHRHDFPRAIVALVGGPLKVVKENGAAEVMHWESGKAYWLDADPANELHMDVNDTTQPIEVMVVEMRNR
jgi:hypothetical protein